MTELTEELEMLNYHERYTFQREEIKAVRKCIKDGLWIGKENGETKFCLDQLMLLSYNLCELYNIPQIEGIIMGDYDSYNWVTHVIELGHISVVSFLHEWRHHYQLMKEIDEHNEPDARAYSLGLFRKACPTAFKNAWKNGQIHFMSPYPTTETKMALKEYDRVTNQMYKIDDDNEEVW